MFEWEERRWVLRVTLAMVKDVDVDGENESGSRSMMSFHDAQDFEGCECGSTMGIRNEMVYAMLLVPSIGWR